MNNKLHIGNHIQNLRENAGISQDQLAEKIGKSKSLISFIENKGKVNDSTLKLIAKSLKVSFEDLKVLPIVDLGKQRNTLEALKLKCAELERENELLKTLIKNQEKIIQLLEKKQ
jgi:transcriptional regulator with XRE-family HTH domain